MRFLIAALAAALPVLAGADPALLNLLPPEAKLVGGVDLAASRGTPFGDYVRAYINTSGGRLNEFVREGAFEPREDLIAVLGGGAGLGRNRAGVMVVRGRFNVPVITGQVRAQGAVVEQYSGVPVISGTRDGAPVAAFPTAGLAILGPPERVRAAIERWKARETMPKEIAAKVAAASAGKQAWFLMLGSPAELAGKFPDKMVSGAMQGDVIKAIEGISGGVVFGPMVDFSAMVSTETARDAEALAHVIRFFVKFAQLTDDPKLSVLVDRVAKQMQLNVAGPRLEVRLSLPEAEFEEVVEMLRSGWRRTPKRTGR